VAEVEIETRHLSNETATYNFDVSIDFNRSDLESVDTVGRGGFLYEMPNKSTAKCCHDNQCQALFCSLCVLSTISLITKK